MTVAVIDLGTNTFHLLVAKMTSNELEVVLRERRFVKLGKDGAGSFSEATLERAKQCLLFFNEKLQKFGDVSIRVIGTAALRSSSNTFVIADFVSEYFHTELEVIDGQKEAELIYKGVTFYGYPNSETNLIVDIGGGSVEFVIFHKEKILYQSSVNIGIGWMNHEYPHSDPITLEEIAKIEEHLDQELTGLESALKAYQPFLMIGASGTFDLIFNQLFEKGPEECISREQILRLLNQYIFTTREARQRDPKIPESRVDYVPLAFSMLRYFLNIAHAPAQVRYSPYALKEGVLREIYLA